MVARFALRCIDPDVVLNPLLGLPRNMPCPCGAKEKWKRCCLLLTKKYIRKEHLPEYKRAMAQALAGERAW